VRKLALLFLLLALPAVAQKKSEDRSCYRGAQQLAQGNFAAALKSLQGVVRDGTSTGSELNLRGVAELSNGDLPRALATFDAAIARDPRSTETRFNRGVTLLRLKRFDEAAVVFEEIAAADPALRSRAQFHRALVAEAKNDLPLTLTWLARAVGGVDAIAEAFLYRGVIQERSGEFAEAGESYRRYLDLRPESVAAMLRFGVVALRAGFSDTAKTMLQRVVRVAPNSAEAAEASKHLVILE